MSERESDSEQHSQLERIRTLHSKQREKYYPTLSKLTPEQLSYYLLKRQKQFIASEAKNVALVAGFGCLRGDTLVVTSQGPVPICDVTSSMQVLSYDAKNDQFLFCPTSGAFLKGVDYLYQVSTLSGEFGAHGDHRVLSEAGEYVSVEYLSNHNDTVLRVFSDLIEISSSHDQPEFQPSVHHWTQILEGLKCRCAKSIHLCGQQLLRLSKAFSSVVQQSVCVQEPSLFQDVSSSTNSNLQVCSVTKCTTKELYYDMVVPDTNNYVTLDGIIHHNSGKSRAGAYKAMLLAARNVGYKGILIANTYRQLKATLLTHFLYLCNARGIKYKHRKGDWELDVWPVDGQPPCSLKLVSASNIEPAVGDPHVAFAIADEVDRLKVERAVEMHEQLTGRCRAGNFNQICYTSTPEGFQFLHKTFVADLTSASEEHKSRFQLIQGRSYDNPFHSTEWIMDMVSQFAPQLVAAYVEGQFVNLRSGTVYVNFDRDFNCSAYTVNTFDNCTLHVGMDFNTGNMSAIIHVVDPKTGYYHAVDEIIGSLNTPALIAAIKHKYQNRRVVLYPDASGSAHDSTANESDLTLLAAAGFPMKVNRANPRIMDRVNSVNSLLLNIKGERRYYVNTRLCPIATQALEQQTYGKDGMPDKTFMIGKYKGDGVLDGIGYFVNQVAPLRARPTLTQIN